MFIENFSIFMMLVLGCTNLALWGTLVMRKHPSARNHHSAMFILGSGLYVLAYFTSIIADPLWLKISLLKGQYLSSLVIGSSWLGQIYQETHGRKAFSRKFMFGVFLSLAGGAGLVLTNEWHHFIWREISLRTLATREILQIEYGIGFHALLITCFIGVLIGGYWFIRARDKEGQSSPKWQRLLLLEMALPLACSVIDMLWGTGIKILPFGFGISGIILGVAGMLKFSTNILPVAHESIFAGMEDGVIVLDLKGRVIELNPKAQEILSTTLAETYGRTLSDLEIFQRADRSSGNEPSWMSRTSELLFEMGEEERYFDLRCSALRNLGEEVGRVLVMRDVSDKKKITNALRDSEESYRSLFERVPVGLYRTKPDGQILDANQALVEILGYPDRDTLVSSNASVHYAEPEGHRVWLEKISSQGMLRDYECHLRRYEGSEVWLRENAVAIRNERGGIEYFEGSLEDITGSKLTMLALEQAQHFTETILDTVGALVLVMDRKGRLVRFNRACERLTGYAQKELENTDLLSFLVPEDEQDSVQEIFKKLRQGSRVRYNENHWRTRSGDERLISWSNALLRGDSGEIEYVVSAGIDITDQRKAEEGLEVYAHELQQSNTELENFAYIASHDLQEPLRMVASYLQLLQRRYSDKLDEDAEEFIGFAVDGAHRMQRLIHGLLEYSRVGTRAGDFHRIDVGEVVKQSIHNLSILLQDVCGEVEIGPLPEVQADETQLQQLFQNLIGNALKFRTQIPPRIRITSEKAEGEWLFAVQDNGIGIDTRYQDRIFKIFQRLHTQEEYPGTGIGLAICKRIVERHGGKIWVLENPESGSVFQFTLPMILPVGDERNLQIGGIGKEN